MHDMWFASKIVILLKEKINAKKLPQRTVVNVVLSPLSHVTRESLLGAFRVLSEKEKFGNVVLNIKAGEPVIKCKKCKAVTKITKPLMECPECGSADFEIKDAEEFAIGSIEIS